MSCTVLRLVSILFTGLKSLACLVGRRMVIPKEDGTFDLRELKLTYCSKVTVLKLFHLKVGNRVLDLNPLTDLKSFVFINKQ
jgi:hypothetical protein